MSSGLVDLLQAADGREVAFVLGSFVFHSGDPVRTVFLVLEGEVRLVRHQEDGTGLVLQRAGRGEILAEASLFSDRHHCDAVAAAATRVKGLPADALRARFRHDPGFAEAWAAHLAREVQRARFRAEIAARRTVAARLDAWLGWQGGAAPRKGEWKAVAEQIGVSPEALYRELGRRRRA